MRLDDLRVHHWSLASATLRGEAALRVYTEAGAATFSGAFHLATCQRKVWVCTDESLPGVRNLFGEELNGIDAYLFLLRVATGLQSQIRGETDIFGQFKEAWKAYCEAPETRNEHGVLLAQLKPWMTRLFEDTKEIRAQYLQNTGGDSYGSLVRKILRKYPAHQAGREIDEPILLVGAGQLAQSVAPWLAGQQIWILNRSLSAAHALAAELSSRHGAQVRVLATAEEQAEGWKNAAHAVLCIPADSALDSERVALWNAGSHAISHPRALIHLGGTLQQLGAWATVPHAFSLDDLFALQREQNSAREELLSRAERACDQKARLRSLSGSSRSSQGSTSLPHGWEDLALFA